MNEQPKQMACGRKELLVLGENGLLRLEALCKNHGMSHGEELGIYQGTMGEH